MDGETSSIQAHGDGERSAVFRFIALCIAIGAALGLAVVRLFYWPGADGWVRRFGVVAAFNGGDFVNMFVGGRLALQGSASAAFDPSAYLAAARAFFSSRLPWVIWSYPPTLLLFVWPLALLPYAGAYALWTLSGLAALFAALRPHSARVSLASAFLLSPAALVNMADGQNGFFTAALLLGGLQLLETRPWLAGACFGILTIKPQLGILVPVALAALRKWSVATITAVAAAGIASVSILVFGLEPWLRYLHATTTDEIILLRDPAGFYPRMMTSVFVGLRSLGAGTPAAAAAQCGALAFALWACWAGMRRFDDFPRRALTLSCATLVATPYAFNYDMTAASAAALLWIAGPAREDPRARLAFALLWLAPGLAMFLNPVAPIAPFAAATPLVVVLLNGQRARVAETTPAAP